MQERLRQLGFAMTLEPIPNFEGIDPHAFDSDEALPEDIGHPGAKLRTTASSHTVGIQQEEWEQHLQAHLSSGL